MACAYLTSARESHRVPSLTHARQVKAGKAELAKATKAAPMPVAPAPTATAALKVALAALATTVNLDPWASGRCDVRAWQVARM